ncbi:MAG TPA: NrsF family protein, partial [Alphaproteobacteria bacterium]|nr:NrsF family protein [Alphaproteobacteria bacterium]
PFALWLATSGYQCYRDWIVHGPAGLQVGESAHCFQFIVLTSIPFGVVLLLALRRALPLDPNRVAMMGGLGVAALAAFVLQFFHPFDVTVMDLTLHIVAVVLVIGGAALGERILDHRAARA